MAKKKQAESHPFLSEAQLAAVGGLFATLSEPTRLRILQLLQGGPASVNEIVGALGIKQGNASKQLGILHRAGILSRTKRATSVVYAIQLPLIFRLCNLVCASLREEAEAKAESLQ